MKRPSAWPALVAYLVAFVGSLLASAVVVAAPVWRYRSLGASRFAEEVARFATSGLGLVAVAATNAAVLFAVAALFVRIGASRFAPSSAPSLRESLRLGPSRLRARALAAALAGMLGLSFACASAVDLVGARNDSVMHTLAHGLHTLPWSHFAIALVAVAIAPGIAEEAFFRGFFQTRVAAAWGRRAALLASAAAFAVIHVDPAQVAVAFAAGVYLGWLADRAGSIRPTMIAHALNNGVFVVLARCGTDGEDPSVSRTASVLVLGAGTLIFVAAAALIAREAPSSEAR